MRRIFIAFAFLLALASPVFAQTVGSGCLPTTGVFSALQEQGFLQAAIETILENGRGTNGAVDCSGAPQEGEGFYNTNSGFSGFASFGIYDSSAFDYFGYIDKGNHLFIPILGGGVATIASAATIDPCSVPQNAISITGTVTISSFAATCQIGQLKFLSFTGSLALTESASLLTPGGGNIATGANDQAIIVYLGGGVWRVAFYQPANGAVTSLSLVGGTLGFNLSGATTLTIPPGSHSPAMLDVADQTASGGANITAYGNGIASGTFAPDCGKGPLQTLTNNGAFNFSVPSNDGSCVIQITNGSSAGSVNFAGYTEGTNVGDALTTTSGAHFNVIITRIAGISHYLATAYQ